MQKNVYVYRLLISIEVNVIRKNMISIILSVILLMMLRLNHQRRYRYVSYARNGSNSSLKADVVIAKISNLLGRSLLLPIMVYDLWHVTTFA